VPDLQHLPATELLNLVRARGVRVAEVVESFLGRVAAREPELHAFAALDPDLLRTQASAVDADLGAAGRTGRAAGLLGLLVGVKDLVDTVDLPTTYGSRIYAGHRPPVDAAVVQRLRAAGALVAGKTVTTEFALFHPGPTRNPHGASRTPGGSSSGSAAAVADALVPVAVGTQTAGSVIRPASFCGVVGFKPSFGAIDRTGVKLISETLDTVGLFARTVADVRRVFDAVRSDGGSAGSGAPSGGSPTLALVRTGHWERAEPTSREGIERLAADLSRRALRVEDLELPSDYDRLVEAQTVVMEVEVARNLAREATDSPDLMSASALGVVERGRTRSAQEYDDALALGADCRARLPELLGGFDAVLTPAVLGEAPPGLDATGDPLFCRSWTLLHTPAVSLPLLHGPHGLPVGVQLTAPPGADDRLLDVAEVVVRAAAR
jgi:Asp-tRNA(Asn)/Glu-tRNA(Gln) amidotransferase A subunit family amidase